MDFIETDFPGLGFDGGMGELLVIQPRRVVNGPMYTGSPVDLTLTIPNVPSLISTRVYVQALISEPGGQRGATEAIELFLGQ